MTEFREWLVLDEIGRGVYESILAEARSIEVAHFIIEAMAGRVAPLSEATYSSESAMVAERLRKAAQRVRWAAMIDRAADVKELEFILVHEYLPLIQDFSEKIRERVDAIRASFDDPDSKKAVSGAKMRVARETGMAVKDIDRLLDMPRAEETKTESAAAEDFDSESMMEEFEGNLKRIVAMVKRDLSKLGYLDEEALTAGSLSERLWSLDKALRAAAAETGNEVPNNKMTALLKSDSEYRQESRKKLIQSINDVFASSFGSIGGDFTDTTGRSRRGEIVAKDERINSAILGQIEALSKRPVTEAGPQPWKEIGVLKPKPADQSPSEWASRLLGGLGKRIKRQASRDIQRQGRGAMSLHGGREDEDGTRGGIDPSDYRTRTSDREVLNRELKNKILEAFRQGMEHVREYNPLHAMLICIRWELDCSGDARLPARNASKILELMASHNASGGSTKTWTLEGFFGSMGVGSDVGASEMENQRVASEIQRINGWETLDPGRSPAPRNPDGTLMLSRPADPVGADKWDKFVKTVIDAMKKAFKRLGEFVHAKLAGTDHAILSGAVEPNDDDAESWDFARFARALFPTARLESKDLGRAAGKDFKLSFMGADGKPKIVWDIQLRHTKTPGSPTTKTLLTMQQAGAPDSRRTLEVPGPVKCDRCEGQDMECQKCRGWGYTINRTELINLERILVDALPRQSRGGNRSED